MVFALDFLQHSQIRLYFFLTETALMRSTSIAFAFWICKILFGFSLETKTGVWVKKKKGVGYARGVSV